MVVVVAGALRALCIVAGRSSKMLFFVRVGFFITCRHYLWLRLISFWVVSPPAAGAHVREYEVAAFWGPHNHSVPLEA